MLYEKLSERKKELGMTTEQLSQLSGVPVGTINKILSGETRSPRYATWQALERVLYGAGGSETGSAEESRNVPGGSWDTAYGHPPDVVREAVTPYLTKRQGEYTVEDYRKLPEDVRAELIDGQLVFMDAPGFTHQELLTELLFELKLFIRKHGGPCRVLPSPLDVQLDGDGYTMVQPDITLICKEERITEKGVFGAPDFCIEIISESTRKKDYGIKVQKYMNAGVREYWIVDAQRRAVITYWFEGELAPYISVYTFRDRIPVQIYGGSLEIDFGEISDRIWKAEA